MWKTYGNPVWYIHYPLTVCESEKAGNHSSKLECHEKYVMPVWVLVTQCLYSAHFQAFCINFEGWAKIWYLYSMLGRMTNCCLISLILKPEVYLNNIKNSVPTAQEKKNCPHCTDWAVNLV